MGRTTTGLIKSLEATTAIPARRLVKFGAANGTGVPAVDGASYIRGVSADIDTAIGERASVQMTGNIADVDYGGAVTRGDPLTADNLGRAIVAAPAAGANMFIVGYAEVSGNLGDIGSVDVLPGRIQG
jgi:hypothetical protein